MRFVAALTAAISAPLHGRSFRAVLRIVAVIVAAVALFTLGFQLVMASEGRDFSWTAGLYWTVVTMTTLGFGDIVFESDLGRLYSIVVLVVGAVLILVLLPFTFIQLVYLPWRNAVREAQAPRQLPVETAGHVILTGRDPVEEALIHRARSAGVPYVLIIEDAEDAIGLSEAGYRVMVGPLDEPATYRSARADRAAMVVAARSDERNSNIAFTVREITDRGIVVATAESADAVDVLHLAGADHVIELGRSLGQAFARRVLTPDATCSEISRFDDLVIAEASAAGTVLVGQPLQDLDLRDRFGVSVVGVWDRGMLQPASPELEIQATSILLLAGRQEALDAYDRAHGPEVAGGKQGHGHVLIIGGGRVGRAMAAALDERQADYRLVERQQARVRRLDPAKVVIGEAADLHVLREAGIDDASAIAITTHDDDTNVFLTLYCRRLRDDVEILGRARIDRNVSTLHRAGADFVLSYASTGATEAWNLLREDSTLLLAEGLVVFRVPMPERLAGRRLQEVDIPSETGCTVIALVRDGATTTEVDGDTVLRPGSDLLLIGDQRAEDRFLEHYVATDGAGWLTRVKQRLAP